MQILILLKSARTVMPMLQLSEMCVKPFQLLFPALKAALSKNQPDLSAWLRQMNSLKSTYPLGYDQPEDGSLSPQHVIQRIGQISGTDTIFTAGVGQHQMWASQFISYEHPRTWLNSGGAGTMGYGVPAAMGAKVGAPDATVWAIDGDGCFQMTKSGTRYLRTKQYSNQGCDYQ
jgi:acetolactate synthase I/II/III large subunit